MMTAASRASLNMMNRAAAARHQPTTSVQAAACVRNMFEQGAHYAGRQVRGSKLDSSKAKEALSAGLAAGARWGHAVWECTWAAGQVVRLGGEGTHAQTTS